MPTSWLASETFQLIQTELPAIFKEFATEPHRYKIAYGGRGSGKSWAIAQLLIIEAYSKPTRILCAREIQRSVADSVLQLLSDTIDRLGLSSFFEVQKTQILAKNGSRFIFEGLRSNVNKIKSMEGIDRVWVEEAEAVTKASWETLIPTIRTPGSQIWVSFNPLRQHDDTYQRFVISPPPDAVVVKVNWSSNPWFPVELNKERLHLKETDPDLYMHVWEGECMSVAKGAYYAKQMREARAEGRITNVPWEQSIPVQTWWDIGIADSTSIWFTQSVGKEIRVIDYEEHSGEGLAFYVKLLREKPYIYDEHWGPHDIRVRELGTGRSRLEQAAEMGLHFNVVKNIPIMDGIQAVRSLFNRCWFDEQKCKLGLDCLSTYHKQFDEINQVYKDRPVHDFSSHGADSFRYFAVGWNEPQTMASGVIGSF
jgi:phage terminase large subunit